MAFLMCQQRGVNSLLAGVGAADLDIFTFQHHPQTFAGVGIIVHYQHGTAGQRNFFCLRCLCGRKRQRYREFGTYANLAFHLNGSRHHVDDVLGDRHA